ncbi:MAG TPA: GlsB/YeaQ/YmgE family stress response membrane protein [Candidatus Limnocylindria bacterium]|nr:GlsB/YeaQ/YmgE family stress response membrane protein [Candidatus Limnocylindria bacterium]
MDIIAWIIVGLVAGWLAGQLMKGSGYGIIGDLVLGLVGAFVGGWLFGVVSPTAQPSGLLGSIVVATIGAVVLIFIARLLGGRRLARI